MDFQLNDYLHWKRSNIVITSTHIFVGLSTYIFVGLSADVWLSHSVLVHATRHLSLPDIAPSSHCQSTHLNCTCWCQKETPLISQGASRLPDEPDSPSLYRLLEWCCMPDLIWFDFWINITNLNPLLLSLCRVKRIIFLVGISLLTFDQNSFVLFPHVLSWVIM